MGSFDIILSEGKLTYILCHLLSHLHHNRAHNSSSRNFAYRSSTHLQNSCLLSNMLFTPTTTTTVWNINSSKYTNVRYTGLPPVNVLEKVLVNRSNLCVFSFPSLLVQLLHWNYFDKVWYQLREIHIQKWRINSGNIEVACTTINGKRKSRTGGSSMIISCKSSCFSRRQVQVGLWHSHRRDRQNFGLSFAQQLSTVRQFYFFKAYLGFSRNSWQTNFHDKTTYTRHNPKPLTGVIFQASTGYTTKFLLWETFLHWASTVWTAKIESTASEATNPNIRHVAPPVITPAKSTWSH